MILFGQGDYTCSVARWMGTHTGPLKGLDGQIHPATHRKFNLEFCTVAHWKNGEIVEEKLSYDLVRFMTQLNLLPKTTVAAVHSLLLVPYNEPLVVTDPESVEDSANRSGYFF